jgi:tetratricopeptide (TPR) repeat protein
MAIQKDAQRQISPDFLRDTEPIFSYIKSGEFEKAYDILKDREGHASDAELGTIHYCEAAALNQMERFGEALIEVNKAISYESSSRVHALKANLLRLDGDHEEALEEVNLSIGKDPYCVDAYLVRGMLYNDFGMWNEAITDFHTAEFLGAGAGRFGHSMAIALSNLGNVDEAMAWFSKTISADPHNIDLYVNACKLLYASSRASEADRLVDEARNKAGDNPWLHTFKAAAYLRVKDFNRAMDEICSTEIKDPAIVENTLGLFKYISDNFTTGAEHIDMMIKTIDRMPRALDTDSQIIDILSRFNEYGRIAEIYNYWILHGFDIDIRFYEKKIMAYMSQVKVMQGKVAALRSEISSANDQTAVMRLEEELRLESKNTVSAEEKLIEASEELDDKKEELDENAEHDHPEFVSYYLSGVYGFSDN